MVNRELRLEIDFKSDPKTVERLAREQLGLARPDETVIRFDVSGEQFVDLSTACPRLGSSCIFPVKNETAAT